MKATVDVLLGEDPRVVGRIHHNAEGARENAAFEYDERWLAASDRFAIDPALPLVRGPQFHKRTGEGSLFHGAIADTEPDGWSRRVILRDHAKRRQQARSEGEAVDSRPLNHLDFLLAVDDASRVGALRFRDADGVFRRAPEPGRRTAPPLVELAHLAAATRSVETNTETAADLEYLRGRGTSLGGLRPKCTVLDDDGHLAIGKFPSVADERPVTSSTTTTPRSTPYLPRGAQHRRPPTELIGSGSEEVICSIEGNVELISRPLCWAQVPNRSAQRTSSTS